MIVPLVRAPVSHPVDIDKLRPTQITLGYREVETRVSKMKRLLQEDAGKTVRKHVIPVVKGPKNHFYVIDHHHLCKALLLAGSKQVAVTAVLDLQRLDKDAFWFFMDNTGLVHPFDEDGKRRDYADIPKHIEDMTDDPFRSLAGALRREGGYAKDTTPFSEFLWADFLRRQVNRKDLEKDFPAALEAALRLAKSGEADYLPGWCGPIDEGG
jgi:hypothetical protein